MFKKMLLFIVLIFLISGCSKIIVKPDVAVMNLPTNPILEGKVIYKKTNKEYLPKMIKDSSHTDREIEYQYSVKYNNGTVDYDGINLFNPLLFAGFPLGSSDLLVSGKLTISNAGIVLNTFEASCVATETRNLFNTGGSSSNRKKCLIEIRYNIDNQIIARYNKGN